MLRSKEKNSKQRLDARSAADDVFRSREPEELLKSVSRFRAAVNFSDAPKPTKKSSNLKHVQSRYANHLQKSNLATTKPAEKKQQDIRSPAPLSESARTSNSPHRKSKPQPLQGFKSTMRTNRLIRGNSENGACLHSARTNLSEFSKPVPLPRPSSAPRPASAPLKSSSAAKEPKSKHSRSPILPTPLLSNDTLKQFESPSPLKATPMSPRNSAPLSPRNVAPSSPRNITPSSPRNLRESPTTLRLPHSSASPPEVAPGSPRDCARDGMQPTPNRHRAKMTVLLASPETPPGPPSLIQLTADPRAAQQKKLLEKRSNSQPKSRPTSRPRTRTPSRNARQGQSTLMSASVPDLGPQNSLASVSSVDVCRSTMTMGGHLTGSRSDWHNSQTNDKLMSGIWSYWQQCSTDYKADKESARQRKAVKRQVAAVEGEQQLVSLREKQEELRRLQACVRQASGSAKAASHIAKTVAPPPPSLAYLRSTSPAASPSPTPSRPSSRPRKLGAGSGGSSAGVSSSASTPRRSGSPLSARATSPLRQDQLLPTSWSMPGSASGAARSGEWGDKPPLSKGTKRLGEERVTAALVAWQRNMRTKEEAAANTRSAGLKKQPSLSDLSSVSRSSPSVIPQSPRNYTSNSTVASPRHSNSIDFDDWGPVPDTPRGETSRGSSPRYSKQSGLSPRNRDSSGSKLSAPSTPRDGAPHTPRDRKKSATGLSPRTQPKEKPRGPKVQPATESDPSIPKLSPSSVRLKRQQKQEPPAGSSSPSPAASAFALEVSMAADSENSRDSGVKAVARASSASDHVAPSASASTIASLSPSGGTASQTRPAGSPKHTPKKGGSKAAPPKITRASLRTKKDAPSSSSSSSPSKAATPPVKSVKSMPGANHSDVKSPACDFFVDPFQHHGVEISLGDFSAAAVEFVFRYLALHAAGRYEEADYLVSGAAVGPILHDVWLLADYLSLKTLFTATSFAVAKTVTDLSSLQQYPHHIMSELLLCMAPGALVGGVCSSEGEALRKAVMGREFEDYWGDHLAKHSARVIKEKQESFLLCDTAFWPAEICELAEGVLAETVDLAGMLPNVVKHINLNFRWFRDIMQEDVSNAVETILSLAERLRTIDSTEETIKVVNMMTPLVPVALSAFLLVEAGAALDDCVRAIADKTEAIIDACARAHERRQPDADPLSFSLSLRGCAGVSNECLSDCLPRFHALHALDLSGIAGLRDAAVGAIGRCVPNLVWLELGGHRDLTDKGVAEMCSEIAKHYPNANKKTGEGVAPLRYLSLRSCSRLTDATLSNISNVYALYDLSVYGCYKLTDGGSISIAMMHSLKRLNTCGCYKITDSGMRYVFAQHPSVIVYNNPQAFGEISTQSRANGHL
eukprot:Rmarinus@m.385